MDQTTIDRSLIEAYSRGELDRQEIAARLGEEWRVGERRTNRCAKGAAVIRKG